MNIYLPDDLATDVKTELGEANISGIAQQALRAELARKQAVAEGGFERVEATNHRGDRVAFRGRFIVEDDHGVAAYMTPKAAIALIDHNERLHTYDDWDSFAEDMADDSDQDFVQAVAEAMGQDYVPVLDI